MNNYIEYNDKIAFHPGYYIKEIVDESGLTQEDFAKRLDTTPKNLSLLIRGEQSLSIDIAMKLSRMIGTTVSYWLNLQNSYDALIAEFKSEKELEQEREIFKALDYRYFRENFGLPDLPRKIDDQIVSMYWGLAVFISIFSRIFLICTVTVAISPMDSISQILENSSSLVNTWLGFWARKVRRSNSLVVKFFSSPFT